MKLNGKKIAGSNKVIIALPRSEGDDIILIAQSVLNYDDFDAACKLPTPPSRIMAKTGEKVYDWNDKGYMEGIRNFSERKHAFMILKSLEATPNLEWETVDMKNPSTWVNWKKELLADGMNDIELQRIQLGVSEANGLNESAISEARENFRRGLEAVQPNSSGQNTEQPST